MDRVRTWARDAITDIVLRRMVAAALDAKREWLRNAIWQASSVPARLAIWLDPREPEDGGEPWEGA